jgi:predicted hotdog family 3-hydroxylacyl-ACP dehydratase
MKELVENGVVVKSLLPDGKIAYSINSDYMAYTVTAHSLLAKNKMT